MASRSAPDTVCELLGAALAPVLGEDAVIGDLRRLSGGASKETWSFTAGGAPLILRRDPPGRPGPRGGMRNEVDVLVACHRAGLAVPEVVFFDETTALGTAGIVMRAVDGEAIPRRILRDDAFAGARSVLTGQVAEFLAGLHAIDPAEVPGLATTDDIANYRAAYDFVDDTSPTFDRAFTWLDTERPTAERQVIVHGDLRMGNVIVDDDGMAAVVDWELMHMGDPIEDLAWFCVKAWRFGSPLGAGGVGEIEAFLTAYEDASGFPVDRAVFDWWLVAKTLTWGVIAMGQAHAHLSGAVRSHELAAIGRRVAETEWDLVELLAPDQAAAARAGSATPDGGSGGVADPAGDVGIWGRPTAPELLDAVADFLRDDVSAQGTGRLGYDARVAANMLDIVERQLAVTAAGDLPRYDQAGPEGLPSWESIARVVNAKVSVANPKYLETS
ncbi:MAG TPA: phosphotransferase [Acidimicrobiales bacterium]|nr:phosphotransferase [Acidimicrobiales bacterium]